LAKEEHRVDSALSLAGIRTDGGTQMREAIDEATVQQYAEHLEDGDEFPAIVVFYDGDEYWLADGFHRVAAYQRAGYGEAPADVRSGQRIDALRYALKANATNGKPRTPGDMRRAYEAAVHNGLCGAGDRKAVHELLGCSKQWARKLTEDAYHADKNDRDARIHELADAGWSQREIAEEVGCGNSTVDRVLGAPKRNGCETGRPQPEFDPEPDDHAVFDSTSFGDDGGGAQLPQPFGGQGGERVKLDGPAPDADANTATDDEDDSPAYTKAVFTGENEWYTPQEYVEAARSVLGAIDLDPATSERAQSLIQASRFYTKEDDALTREWGGRVWLNPPYSQPDIAHFVSKAVHEYAEGRVSEAVVLTHNYTDTRWFHELFGAADAVCFTRGRVKFYNQDGEVAAPSQGQAFTYFGANVPRFAEIFSAFGFVLVPSREAAA
jgi:phage N-6-adenine-methyltransferase